MTEKSDSIVTWLSKMFFFREPPWAVALAGFLAKSLYTEYAIPRDIGVKFDALNAKLIHWWPGLQPPLGKIYSIEYVECVNIYAVKNKDDKELVRIETALLNLSMVQIRVLFFIEEQLGERRPRIGNDIFEIVPELFESFVRDYLATASNERARFLWHWIEILSDPGSMEWEEGLSRLFEPIGGPPPIPH